MVLKVPPTSRKPTPSRSPTICPALLMPYARVKDAPGTSMVVNVPPTSRKPCQVLSVTYPTICPASFMPSAKRAGDVNGAEGPAHIEETVESFVVSEVPNDLPGVVDARCACGERAGDV